LGGMEWGTGKFHFFTANSENIDKIWKFSPNSKKPKIGQDLKYHFKTANSEKYYQKLEIITKLLKPQI
jgi:hypothetical protein